MLGRRRNRKTVQKTAALGSDLPSSARYAAAIDVLPVRARGRHRGGAAPALTPLIPVPALETPAPVDPAPAAEAQTVPAPAVPAPVPAFTIADETLTRTDLAEVLAGVVAELSQLAEESPDHEAEAETGPELTTRPAGPLG